MKPNDVSSSLDIRSMVINCLKEFKQSDREITDASNTHYDLGFSSEDGVYIACIFEETFDICLPHDVNPLIDDSGKFPRARRVGEVIRFIEQYITAQENHHAQSRQIKSIK